jgi:hypothetical protein
MGNDSPPVKSFPIKSAAELTPDSEINSSELEDSFLHPLVVYLQITSQKYMNMEPGGLWETHQNDAPINRAVNRKCRIGMMTATIRMTEKHLTLWLAT